jgi:hypothetical protein
MSDTDKERERRRKKYKFALVRWTYPMGTSEIHSVEYKQILRMKMYVGMHEVICDDQPERVLKGMLKLLKEDK